MYTCVTLIMLYRDTCTNTHVHRQADIQTGAGSAEGAAGSCHAAATESQQHAQHSSSTDVRRLDLREGATESRSPAFSSASECSSGEMERCIRTYNFTIIQSGGQADFRGGDTTGVLQLLSTRAGETACRSTYICIQHYFDEGGAGCSAFHFSGGAIARRLHRTLRGAGWRQDIQGIQMARNAN